MKLPQSQIAPKCKNEKKFETSAKCLLKNGEVVLGLGTARHRNLT